MPFPVLLPHQDAAQVGVSVERDAEHVVALALEPIGARVQVGQMLGTSQRRARRGAPP